MLSRLCNSSHLQRTAAAATAAASAAAVVAAPRGLTLAVEQREAGLARLAMQVAAGLQRVPAARGAVGEVKCSTRGPARRGGGAAWGPLQAQRQGWRALQVSSALLEQAGSSHDIGWSEGEPAETVAEHAGDARTSSANLHSFWNPAADVSQRSAPQPSRGQPVRLKISLPSILSCCFHQRAEYALLHAPDSISPSVQVRGRRIGGRDELWLKDALHARPVVRGEGRHERRPRGAGGGDGAPGARLVAPPTGTAWLQEVGSCDAHAPPAPQTLRRDRDRHPSSRLRHSRAVFFWHAQATCRMTDRECKLTETEITRRDSVLAASLAESARGRPGKLPSQCSALPGPYGPFLCTARSRSALLDRQIRLTQLPSRLRYAATWHQEPLAARPSSGWGGTACVELSR